MGRDRDRNGVEDKDREQILLLVFLFCFLLLLLPRFFLKPGAFNDTEEAFLEVPDAKSAESFLEFLTRLPHVAGTDGDKNLAEFVRHEFVEAGIPNVSIEDLVVKLNYPDLDAEVSSSLSLWETTGVESEDYASEEEEEKGNLFAQTNIFDETLQNKLNAPPKRKLVFRASLSEDRLDPDVDETTDTYWRNHTFHGYSPSGNLTHTQFVYANYGRPQDFGVLESVGISVVDKIVLMRYGKCFRGLKVRNAQERGALGAILYSDPADDGYILGDVYPDGPWRPPSGVQRGSVQFNSICAGDPYRADPRYQSLETSVESLCNVTNVTDLIPSIPSMPISYRDAIPLLQNLGGEPVKEIPEAVANEFVGGLGNTSTVHNTEAVVYRLGPSKGYLDMEVRNIDATVEIPNVVGVIPGRLKGKKDQPILLGNHRDAWVYGAADPNSGTSTLLEVARGLGYLYKFKEWRPLRSIYLLSWSGEEYGLLGSTGWAELNMLENQNLRSSRAGDVELDSLSSSTPKLQQSLAYLNTDTVVSGDHLQVSASPTLVTAWNEVITDLRDTAEKENNTQVLNFIRNVTVLDANIAREFNQTNEGDTPIGVLGSGSDYTVFLDHFGIPSLDFSFTKERAHYGQYHSIYDSFAWMEKFGGHTAGEETVGSAFELMAFAAKIWGVLAIRLAESEVVLLDHIFQGEALNQYLSRLKDSIANHPHTFSEIIKLENGVEKYNDYAGKAATECEKASKELAQKKDKGKQKDKSRIDALTERVDLCNEKLGLTERCFLLDDGLPGRPWFKHSLQAPGLDLGYAAQAFPGIQQALDQGDYKLAGDQIDVVADRVWSAATNLQFDEYLCDEENN